MSLIFVPMSEPSHISAQPMTNHRPMRFAPARSLQNGIGGVLRHIQNTIGSETA